MWPYLNLYAVVIYLTENHGYNSVSIGIVWQQVRKISPRTGSSLPGFCYISAHKRHTISPQHNFALRLSFRVRSIHRIYSH